MKAGLASTNRDDIDQKVKNLSKGSKFYQNEERRAEKIRERIADLQLQKSKLSPRELALNKTAADLCIKSIEAKRDLSKTIVHVDMDAFFCAVEELDNPQFKSVPMAVGSSSMLCTANYPARKFGVRSAMPGYIAKQLCPQLVIVPTCFEKYKKSSELVQQVFQNYDPQYEMMSLDEAFLDITGYLKDYAITASEAVEKLRAEVFEKTFLTCSAGIAPNKLLAKICSDLNKPNGQLEVIPDRDAIMNFISEINIRKVPGIGRVTEKLLNSLGVEVCGDMLKQYEYLHALFSSTLFEFLISSSLGIGSNVVGSESTRKSTSAERTFNSTDNPSVLKEIMDELATSISQTIKDLSQKGKTISIKIKYDDFQVITRAKTLDRPTNDIQDIRTVSRFLLDRELEQGKFVRLLGIRISHLQNSMSPMEAFVAGIKSIDKAKLNEYTCPVCSKFIANAAKENSNNKFNQHIDLCLNKGIIK